MYVKIERGTARRCTLAQVRAEHPQVSLPENPSEVALAGLGVYVLHAGRKPAYHPATQALVELEPVQRKAESGAWEWVQAWGTRPLTAQEQEAARAERAVVQRRARDRMIKDSDWTQLGDAPVDKQAWASYRAALRAVPQQSGFPWDIEWPVAPA